MLLPTRVGEKKSQVKAWGKSVHGQSAQKTTPESWNSPETVGTWTTFERQVVKPFNGAELATFLFLWLLARYFPGCIYYLHLAGQCRYKSDIGTPFVKLVQTFYFCKVGLYFLWRLQWFQSGIVFTWDDVAIWLFTIATPTSLWTEVTLWQAFTLQPFHRRITIMLNHG